MGITGNMASTLGAANPFRYKGYYYDNETGLYYLNARYYNPSWGRFINADSYGGNVGGLLSHNVFAYCYNNPIIMVDSSGHSATLLGAFFGGIFGGIVAAIKGESIAGGVIGGAVAGALVGSMIDSCGASTPLVVTVIATGVGGYVGGGLNSMITQTANEMEKGASFGEAYSRIDYKQVHDEALWSGVTGGLTGMLSWAFRGAMEAVEQSMNATKQVLKQSTSLFEAQYLTEQVHEWTKAWSQIVYWNERVSFILASTYTGVNATIQIVGTRHTLGR